MDYKIANIQKIRFVKIVDFVPDDKIWKDSKFVRSGYEIKNLGFCRLD